MKFVLALLMTLFATLAAAQPGPPRGPGGPDFDRRYGPPPAPLSCWEWRRDAQRHACVRIPRRCMGPPGPFFPPR